MRTPKSPLLAIGAIAVLTGCNDALTIQQGYQVAPQLQTQSFDVGQASLRLAVGQTEAEAIAAVGHRPISAESSTCGTATENPWSCKTLTFGPEHGLDAKQLLVRLNTEVTPARVAGWDILPAPLNMGDLQRY